jgi:hypothetical protein
MAKNGDDSVDFLKQQVAMEALEAYIDERMIEFGSFAIKFAKEQDGEMTIPWMSPPEA